MRSVPRTSESCLPVTRTRLRATYEIAEHAIAPLRDDLEPLVLSLETLEKKAKKASSRVRLFFSRPRSREEARQALSQLKAVLQASATRDLQQRLDEAATRMK